MPHRKWTILIALIIAATSALAQRVPADTVPKEKYAELIDTSLNYEDPAWDDIEQFLDSILSPHSYFLASLSAGKGYYNFESKTTFDLTTEQKLTYSPTLGYYHKSGFGITATGYVIDDGDRMNFFQGAVSPSFDYLRHKRFAAGVSFTRYVTKDSLNFYTTPLQNELYGYFTYRKWWMKPMIALNYGWGARSDAQERETIIEYLRLRRNGFTYIDTRETINDFSVTASIRHDFYWLDVLANRDHFRFTPQVSFTAGTQKYGFNQSSTTYATLVRNSTNVLFNTDNIYLDDSLGFQPLSLTLYLRGEYAIGKFFLQPQFAFDYYFPATDHHFNLIFSINLGAMF